MFEKKPANTSDEGTNSIKRRGLLKTIGASSGAVGFGILGTSTASADQADTEISSAEIEKVNEAKQRYATSEAAKGAIHMHGEQLLEELKKRDILESETELHTADFTPKKEYSETSEGMGMTSFLFNDTPTAHIYTSKKLRDQHLTVVVQPQVQRSYAILRPDATDHRNAVTIDTSTDNSFSVQATCHDYFCLYDDSTDDPTPGDNCWLDKELYNRYMNADGSCYLGDFSTCCDVSAKSCNTAIHCGTSDACNDNPCT
ncbi:hypothetical protein [Haladaptatus sp. R4]|uniref:hypothetical protein n=1 Tax=Haladaptatus sp. R4 TaxID=1679489 RepID=UPI000A79B55C|nr:hypothetical protein [Haladaptatus sp. R4]